MFKCSLKDAQLCLASRNLVCFACLFLRNITVKLLLRVHSILQPKLPVNQECPFKRSANELSSINWWCRKQQLSCYLITHQLRSILGNICLWLVVSSPPMTSNVKSPLTVTLPNSSQRSAHFGLKLELTDFTASSNTDNWSFIWKMKGLTWSEASISFCQEKSAVSRLNLHFRVKTH